MTIRSTFTWSTAMLVLTAQLSTVGIALYFASTDAERRARDSLEIAHAVALSFMEERRLQLTTSVKVLAQDFAFRQAIATGDLATVRSALDNHASRIHADHAMLLTSDGEFHASAGGDLAYDLSLWQRISSNPDQLITLTDGRDDLYQVVVAPVMAPTRIGWVSMGFKVDDALAMQIRSMTGTEVQFTPPDAADRSYASTAIPGQGGEAFTLSRQLPSIGQPIQLEVSTPKARALDAFFRLRNFTVTLSAVALVAAALLGVFLAGRITRNLNALTGVAREIEGGNYSTTLPDIGGDETAKLSGALQAMQQGIAQREAEIRHQSLHDSLTGLPNHDSAVRALEMALAVPAAAVTVIVAVVRGLQDVNSSLGLELGDRAMQQIARLLESGKPRYLARLADTRFMLLTEDGDQNSVTALASVLQEQLQQVSIVPGVHARFEIACGAVSGRAGDDARVLLRRAWSASLEAAERRQQLAWFTIDHSARQERRLTIMRDLPIALSEGRFGLVFQPKYHARSLKISGVEALLRWQHPELGFIPPDEFVAIAEQTRDIEAITRWVIGQALDRLVGWRLLDPEFGMAVNVSAHDVCDDRLGAFICAALSERHLQGRGVELEVTEGALVGDLASASRTLEEITRSGVRVAIDDYGTGYSSLSQLRNLPAQVLKIDKSFVMTLCQDRRNQQIVRSTIRLAHALGMKVVAEGVEDQPSLEQLAGWGCDFLQGYHLSRPVADVDITTMLEVVADTSGISDLPRSAAGREQ